MIVKEKPKSFYKIFERKGPGQKTTHYCPGCGHGTAHKLLAEIIDEMGIQDRTVFLSPVGCSVFAYYYFDTGNIQCSHGRAPAVGTGVKRVRDDAVVISYQGDGDLAGIGTTEIIHAANRGENMTVIFINNAIYGMTGGQMAPTTLSGQKTLTTPEGRDLSLDGAPIGMAEVMNALAPPVYIERVSLSSPAGIMKTRRAFKKALQNQIDKKGFSFVEVLSPCPINWKMDPVRAREWMKETMEEIFPPGCLRDTADQCTPHTLLKPLNDTQLMDLFRVKKELPQVQKQELPQEQHIKISGFGGQGVLSAGILLANCVIAEGLEATWLPSYGPEMRGGTANASVILSQEAIGSPVVDEPNILMAMNLPSLLNFEEKVLPGGLIIVNSSVVDRKVKRKDVKALYVPASEMARNEGLISAANIVMLTVYLLESRVVDLETFKAVLPLSLKKKEYLDLNLRLIQKAEAFYAGL
ncbi:2-oxoacid:acceptor oxidoreductase family protein [Marispirochaeta aestuarii]|uniref:2-oxoacid:acceptor oxidoreductase family protein n=1 Tax=Marispirochaeta aestuarii TaxID=1963862 RepID=UPI002ABD19A2|nr:2-oxoacid:acceptor oxidoreductase family protein [Marispirochaeta aestuarii]